MDDMNPVHILVPYQIKPLCVFWNRYQSTKIKRFAFPISFLVNLKALMKTLANVCYSRLSKLSNHQYNTKI
ncbi:MAG: hypothetical protein CMH47_07650 [Muricauda sp.]|nr:hypothetical protein [Allomuricauda sp.]